MALFPLPIESDAAARWFANALKSAAGQLQQIWVSLSDLPRLIDRSEIDGLIVEAFLPYSAARGARGGH